MTLIIEQPQAAETFAKDVRAALCAHCGLPVPSALMDADAIAQFCCAGCGAVYDTLHACGLESYYQLRDAAEKSAWPAHPTQGTFAAFDSPKFHQLYVREDASGLATADLALEGVSCAACVWLLERLPRVLDGVIEARLSLRQATVRITWDPRRLPLSRIARTLDSLGYTPFPARGQSARQRHQREARRRMIHLGVAGAIMGNTMLLAFALYAGGHGHMDSQFRTFFRWISALLASISLAWPGSVFFRSAWAAIRLRAINLDVPIALALAAGGVAGLINVLLNRGEIYFDSLTVLIFLLLVGRFIQYRQQRWAEDAVDLLFSLTPSTCRIVKDDQTIEAPIESLQSGDTVQVHSGEIFPADGVVLSGNSHANQALLTGESKPCALVVGSPVHAGAQNIGGVLRVRVDQLGRDTRVGRLMTLIERGIQEKPAIVQFADKVGAWFVAAVSLAAVGVFGFWVHRANVSAALDHAVALLIVTCPCVLGLATPLTIAIAIGRLARRDILVKSGVAIERLSRGGTLILDKTGTLTEGRLQLTDWFGERSAQGIVAEIERASAHPVGKALHDALSIQVLDASSRQHISTTELGDGGIRADAADHDYHICSLAYLKRHGIEYFDQWRPILVRIEAAGHSPVAIARDGQIIAVAALGDRLRADAAGAVAQLRRFGWSPEIFSGDAQAVVSSVATQTGINPANAHGVQSPEDKLARVRQHEDRGAVVMVGDGVNDAAALAAADVGIAVHGGAEASLAAADVYIARPGLAGLIELVQMSRRAMRTIHHNLEIALAYNIVAGVLAACGWMSPLIAAILMPLSSVTVLSFATLSMSRRSRADSSAPSSVRNALS